MDRYPKVLVLITTFNRPEYLQFSLESAMAQTWPNLEIVVTDDSTDDRTERMMQRYLVRDPRIRYFKHEGFSVYDHGLWVARYIRETPLGYINWLMDDDVIYPDKIARMMSYYLERPDVSLVTSRQHTIDGAGNPIDGGTPPLLGESTNVFDGESIGRAMLCDLTNYVGEFSTTLVKKDFLLEGGKLGWVDDRDFAMGFSDVPTWLHALTKGNLAYIADPLSALRVHEGQMQKDMGMQYMGHSHWLRLLLHARKTGKFLVRKQDFYEALAKWMAGIPFGLELLAGEDSRARAWEGILAQAADACEAFMEGHCAAFPIRNDQIYGEKLPFFRSMPQE